METSRWSAPALTRHKTAILTLTAVALGCSLYYLRDQLWSSAHVSKPHLRRSNARRQRHRRSFRPPGPTQVPPERARYVIDAPWGSTPIDLAFLRDPEANEEVLALHFYRSRTCLGMSTSLARHMPSAQDIGQIITDPEEARRVRQELELAFLQLYLWRYLSPSPLSSEQQEILLGELQRDGDFSDVTVGSAIQSHQGNQLTERIEEWTNVQQRRRQEAGNGGSRPPHQGTITDQIDTAQESLEDREAATDDESEHSWRGENGVDDDKDAGREGQSLLNLLYRIAEEQARKDGYVHRRVTCNSCNMMPIRGIRYHCANCLDYDLCEQCEAMQIHPKTHIFYKIRIPAPFIRNPRQPEPAWYPGKPAAVNHALERGTMASICKNTGYQIAEVEALWEQFRCLAATEWLEDPDHYCLAIDRQTFNKCFIPHIPLRPSAPNLIYDRMFSFYDTDGNNLIGFQEFIYGLASLTKNNPAARQRRLFKGYDIDDNGFVDRKDFLRMFRAYYSLTKELTCDVLAAMEEDVSDNEAQDIVLGSQPISSAFTGGIPRSDTAIRYWGKSTDNYGDSIIRDDMGAVDVREHEFADIYDTMADAIEMAQYGDVMGLPRTGCSNLYTDPWPPQQISYEDVEKVLAPAIQLEDVTLPEDQKAIRRVAHARIAHSFQKRSFTRRKAIRERKQRRAFYLDGEDGGVIEDAPEPHHHDSNIIAQADLKRTKNLLNLVDNGRSEAFYAVLKDRIEELNWPTWDAPMTLAQEIGELILLGWNGVEIAEDLFGYAADLQESKKFVLSLSDSLEEMARELGLEAVVEGDITKENPLNSIPSLRRSRSSSKVRFQDDLGTEGGQESRSRATSLSSRSIPVNERWGGPDVPEPEKDVGREVLYQVTQEAFNELLDPIFRLREDLALAALQTRRLREKYRGEIIAAVDSPMHIKNELDTYQRWWRTEPFKASDEAKSESDEAATFFAFLVQREAGVQNSLTSEQCHRCARNDEECWIGIGQFCSKCGLASRIAQEERDERLPRHEPCRTCADKGEQTYFGPGQNYCSWGHPSPEVAKEVEKLQGIISGRYMQPVARVTAVNEGENSSTRTRQGSTSNPAPEIALDLDDSAAVLDEADALFLEEETPHDEFLADPACVLSTTSRSASRTPDHALPHNRPTRVSSPDIARVADLGPGSLQLPDPTLPQHRPNGPIPEDDATTSDCPPLDVNTTQGRLYSDSPRPDPTLPQNRPNAAMGINPATDRNPKLHIPVKAPTQSDSTDVHAASATQWNRTLDKPPDRNTLRYWAALDMVEFEDSERGGAGRLSFKEWEQVMKSAKGKALAFLGTWIDMASF